MAAFDAAKHEVRDFQPPRDEMPKPIPPDVTDPRPVTDAMIKRAMGAHAALWQGSPRGTLVTNSLAFEAMRAALEAAAMTPDVGHVMAYEVGLAEADKPWNDAVDWLLNTSLDPDDRLRFDCIDEGLMTVREAKDATVDELMRRQALAEAEATDG
jgi:hypothetical protein